MPTTHRTKTASRSRSHKSRPARRRAHARAAEPRLLVATAGEPESRGALNVAAALSARDHSDVLVLGVATPFPHNVSTMVSMRRAVPMDEESRLEVLARVRHSLADIQGADTWVTRAFIGLPADEIQSIAGRWGASLIVLGQGRHNRMDRIFGTETAIAVMRHARIPVLAVHGTASKLPTCALAAIDFTPASMAAASAAAMLLGTDGTLIVAHVSAFRSNEARPGGLVEMYRAGAKAKLDDAVQRLERGMHCTIESVLLDGEPGKALVTYARERHCDLIALGGHEMGLVDRILLGSVRTRVVRDAPCSVLIAPPDRAGAI